MQNLEYLRLPPVQLVRLILRQPSKGDNQE